MAARDHDGPGLWSAGLVLASAGRPSLSGSTRPGGGAYEALWVAAAVSLVLAGLCLTLPHTPHLAVGQQSRDTLRQCFDLAREPDIAVPLATSFRVYVTAPMVSQILPGYLESRGLPRAWISSTMTLGQMTEIATLAVLPWSLRRFGAKGTMTIGIGAWFVRFLSLAIGPPIWVAIGGTLLHGVGFACFTVGGQVYIDSRCKGDLRASAQSLMLVCTSGTGALLASVMAGELRARTSPGDVLVFLIPCVIDGALLLYFLRGFRAPVSSIAWAGAESANPASAPQAVRGTVAHSGHLVTESADG